MDASEQVGQLVRAYRGGDPEALGRLVAFLQPRLQRRAWVVLRDEQECEDVFVEVITSLLPLLRTIELPEAFYSYARRAARSRAIDQLRRRADRDHRRALRDTEAMAKGDPGRRTAPIERLASLTTPETRALRDERRDRVRAEIETLSEPARELLVRIYFRGESVTLAAEALGLSESTARRAVLAARSVLAVRLARQLGEEPLAVAR